MHIPALPRTAGVGFKPVHFDDLQTPGAVTWLEVHAENYMLDGGPRRAMLAELSTRFPISAHGVGLSIGGLEPPDQQHLARLRDLLGWLEPAQFSEHLAWSSHEGAYFNDLLPLPYTQQTLDRVCAHINIVQDYLGRQMLLENPSSYLVFDQSVIPEPEFLAQVAVTTGCGMLLDVNNVFVSATNLGQSAQTYIDSYPLHHVGEIHLAGFDRQYTDAGAEILIDSHSREVADPVWALYRQIIERTGPRPTLIEWDNDVPDFPTLQAEAARAAHILQGAGAWT